MFPGAVLSKANFNLFLMHVTHRLAFIDIRREQGKLFFYKVRCMCALIDRNKKKVAKMSLID